MAEQRLPPPTEGPLLPWLVVALKPVSRTKVKEWLTAGRILVNGKPVTRHDHALTASDRVTVGPATAKPKEPTLLEQGGLTVLYTDAAVTVVDKPAGLLSVATEGEKLDTAYAWLNADRAARRLGPPAVVHRLDRDTSGLLMFAHSAELRETLQESWDQLTKRYFAVVVGTPNPPEGLVEDFIHEGRDLKMRRCVPTEPGAKLARSRYRTVRSVNGLSLVEVDLLTGRKHQIRVHLANLGHPVVGDRIYGDPGGRHGGPASRLGLHACELAFPHPVHGKPIRVTSPLPTELRRLVPG
jgi:23S rRNA pseudouridine1911/1915/1917 synthase